MAVITTYGTSSSFISSALMGLGATSQNPNGRFFVDGQMAHVELSRTICEAIYIKDRFRDGQSITKRYSVDPRNTAAVRVPLRTPFKPTSRTLSYGGRQGTNGNGGVLNTNPDILPAMNEFFIYLNQVNDTNIKFPEMAMSLMPLYEVASVIDGFTDSVAETKNASQLAEILLYNIFRALNGANNLVNVADPTATNAMSGLLKNLNAKFSNGDYETGAHTYATEGRTILGRPEFVSNFFDRNSGVILLGGDLAQTMLLNYDLDRPMDQRGYVGQGYKGKAMGFHIQEIPDILWTMAELYCGVPVGSFDHIQAVACYADANAAADGLDFGLKFVDDPDNRGIKAQSLQKWGHESFRKSWIIGDNSLTTSYLGSTLGFSADARQYPVAPADMDKAMSGGVSDDFISVPVYGADGTIKHFVEIAKVPTPNGGNVASGLPTCAPVVETSFTSNTIKLECDTTGATIYYTLDGTTPTSSSTAYTSAGITISADKTVKAIAVKDGYVPSDVYTKAYEYSA